MTLHGWLPRLSSPLGSGAAAPPAADRLAGRLGDSAVPEPLAPFTPDIGMLVTSGRAVTTFNPDTGEFTLVSHQGHAEDVCAALAP